MKENITQISIINDNEDNEFFEYKIINMLPYHDNDPELLMDKEQIMSIINAIQYKYGNAVVNIMPLTVKDYNRIIPFIRGKSNVLINRIYDLLDIVLIINNKEPLVIDNKDFYKNDYFKDNNFKIIYAEYCMN